ncbi:ABC transporter ATP-binding protein [Paenibacillus durus]|uniref:Peptide ABC transporter ATP-binding protein n=1 Tax=Paenibacillus durus ATCC 35681 TaxID=1333534 RepID=A0A0F7CI19_PAEDU|nr:ABC transporter ATP-binding protein [Paenibacillus durus]AKG34956.1 peptide ABC transporter ATP-binding protein [Paenibacillus durus ATCC 35681]
MPLIETKQLAKKYGQDETTVQALYPLDLTINENEFLAIVGPSGSGKSTLLQLLGGLDTPSSGKVTIEGQDLYAMNERERSIFRRRNFGFIFQSFNLIPILTAEENITMPLLLDGKKPDMSYLRDLSRKLGIEERLHHLPGQLSGGQQQRVAIARALSGKPKIVFADEPTGNLDTRTGEEVLDLLIESVREFGKTLIVITHDPKVAERASSVLNIVDGRIMEGARQ